MALCIAAYLFTLLFATLRSMVELRLGVGSEMTLLAELIKSDQTVEAYENAKKVYGEDWWKKGDFLDQKRLAERLGRKEPTITRWVSKLRERGLVRVEEGGQSKFPLAEEEARRYVLTPVWKAILYRLWRKGSDADGIVWWIWFALSVIPIFLGAVLRAYSDLDIAAGFLLSLGTNILSSGIIITPSIWGAIKVVRAVLRRRRKWDTNHPLSAPKKWEDRRCNRAIG